MGWKYISGISDGRLISQYVLWNAVLMPLKGLMWNFALDGSGNPKLPGTNSCGGPGCRPLVTVNSDGTYELNQECRRDVLCVVKTLKPLFSA